MQKFAYRMFFAHRSGKLRSNYHSFSDEMSAFIWPKPGVWVKHEGEVIPCKSGFHGCYKLNDLNTHGCGSVLGIVEVDGKIVHHYKYASTKPSGKFAAEKMRIVQTFHSDYRIAINLLSYIVCKQSREALMYYHKMLKTSNMKTLHSWLEMCIKGYKNPWDGQELRADFGCVGKAAKKEFELLGQFILGTPRNQLKDLLLSILDEYVKK